MKTVGLPDTRRPGPLSCAGASIGRSQKIAPASVAVVAGGGYCGGPYGQDSSHKIRGLEVGPAVSLGRFVTSRPSRLFRRII